MDKFVLVENVSMVFKTKSGSFTALKDVNMSVAEGEFVTLIGHSGCGKSTLLNLVAGLLVPSTPSATLWTSACRVRGSAWRLSMTADITSVVPACSNSCIKSNSGLRPERAIEDRR